MINLLIISALNVKEKEEEEQMGRRKRWKTRMKEKRVITMRRTSLWSFLGLIKGN